MELAQEKLAELKCIEVEMLRAFIEVCNQLNLRYYLIAGTLLGAVRHQGFIPWDDDIDIGMPREDYEVFLSHGQDYMPKHMFIQSIHSDPEYMMCFAKIRNSNTTFIETSVHHLKINHGVFIDIFPLDYYPESISEQKRLNAIKNMYNRRLLSVFNLPGSTSLKFRAVSFVLKCIFPSVKAMLRKREDLYRSVPKGALVINYGGAWGEREIMPASWYDESTTLLFEGIEVSAPKQYHSWLTQVYGDYMKLPPVEKRVTHHYTDIIDLHRAYTEYI